MSQFEQYGVADVYQLGSDVVIPAGTNVAIKRLANGHWTLRADLLREGDAAPRIVLPEKLARDLVAAQEHDK